jgi:hypothetical protein
VLGQLRPETATAKPAAVLPVSDEPPTAVSEA